MARYNLLKLRKTLGLTQQELAKRLNLSQGFLSSVESGRNPFPDDRVEDLQAIFPNENLDNYLIQKSSGRSIAIGNNNKSSDIRINDPESLKALLSIIRSESLDVKTSDDKTDEQQSRGVGVPFDKLIEQNSKLQDELMKSQKRVMELLEENAKLKVQLAGLGVKQEDSYKTQ